MKWKQYTKEFKLEASKLAEKIGVPRAAVDLGVAENLLYRWRKAAETEAPMPSAATVGSPSATMSCGSCARKTRS